MGSNYIILMNLIKSRIMISMFTICSNRIQLQCKCLSLASFEIHKYSRNGDLIIQYFAGILVQNVFINLAISVSGNVCRPIGIKRMPDSQLGFHHGIPQKPWWRHQMEIFSALLAICAGNSPVTGEFPTQRPLTQNLDVFLDLRLNKRFSKQSWG